MLTKYKHNIKKPKKQVQLSKARSITDFLICYINNFFSFSIKKNYYYYFLQIISFPADKEKVY